MEPIVVVRHLSSIGLVLIGAIFMFISIRLALNILPVLPLSYTRRWKVLVGMMVFFFFGYLLFVLIIISHLQLPVELVTGVVFFTGSIFVFLMLRLTKLSIINLREQETLLQKNNETLENRVADRTGELRDAIKSLNLEMNNRQRSLEELDTLHNDLNQVLNTTSTGIRKIGMDHTVLVVNRKFCEISARPQAELIGEKCYANFRDDSCKDSPYCLLTQIKSGVATPKFECEKQRYDQKMVTCYCAARGVYDKEGNLTGIVEDVQDITEKKIAALEKERLRTQILHKSKLESVGQLAAGIAHEINTPVQYVGSNIEFLSDSFQEISSTLHVLQEVVDRYQEGILDATALDPIRNALKDNDWDFLEEEIPTALEQTREGIDRVRTIVQAMKEFSYPATREMAPANLNRIISNTILISQNEWKYTADLTTDLDPELPEIPCLSDELGQVLLNLITNATQAIKVVIAEKEGQKGAIQITTRLVDNYAEILIRDNGSGIPGDIQDKIFDPFFTTKEVGQGTGQGLSISYDIIGNKHHGKLTFESTPGVGTTFCISLPLGGKNLQSCGKE